VKRQRRHSVFGPVPSRRLGRSLGVDLVPFKTCTFDCIYCQLGRTTRKTVVRKEWVPMDAVLDELKHELDHLNGVLICDYNHPEADKCAHCPLELAAELVEERVACRSLTRRACMRWPPWNGH
jgi:wyosine [tRNA(Phe)-imidazoG37] synthetase (radical SAM superfamily)